MKPLAAALAAVTLAACSRNVQTKEAIREAVVEYLTAKQSQTGLDMSAMSVEVVSVTFRQDSARATVAFNLKSGAGGMRMAYNLDRQGDTWVVRSGSAAGGSASTLPPNHPPVDGGSEK